MKVINFTKEILGVLAVLLPFFGKFQDEDCVSSDELDTFFALLTPTLDGRYFVSLFCEGDPVWMCPVGVVDDFMVWDDKRAECAKAGRDQYHLCFARFLNSRVNLDVFGSVSKKQSRLYGPLGIQEFGEAYYKQSLQVRGCEFVEYYGKMALSNLLTTFAA